MKVNFKRNLVYIVIIFVVFSGLSIGKYLHFPPNSIHTWAQADRASIAYCYYQYNYAFLLPHTLNVSNVSGITGVEFPLIYYFVSLLYKLFGMSDFIFRLVVFCISLLGILAALNLIYKFSKSVILPFLLIGIIVLSPVYIYYSFNYLPDIVALSFTFISIYFFFDFRQNPKTGSIILFLTFAALASLIKITFAIYTVALALSLFVSKDKVTSTKSKILITVSVFISIIASLAWYSYSIYLNKHFNGNVFMMEYRIVQSWDEFVNIFTKAYSYWAAEFSSPLSIFMVILSYIIVLYNWKKIDRFLITFLIFSFLGNLAYIFLFFTQFLNHDYYFILFYGNIFVLLLCISELEILNKVNSKFLMPFVVILILINFGYTNVRISDRFNETIKHSQLLPDQSMYALIGMDKKFDEAKISRNSKFIVFYDYSMNISLYYIGRQGIPVNYKWDDYTLRTFLDRKDIDYLLLLNSDWLLNSEILKNRLGELAFTSENIKVYKLLH